jgi:class 3 adenylate cyclase/tetratricopeptide (TPR) repeat protein/tRNA A-37 threonylcarbamoyl transferase component Bud32
MPRYLSRGEVDVDLPAPFGKYELLERIATGGMAEVFLARSFGVAGFEKRLVIKRIRPEYAEDPRFREMFVHEARIAVWLNHPNVVQVYELDRVGHHLYMAMEHLHGRDLTRLVRSFRALERKIPLPVAVAIVAEVCRGLAYAHARTDGQGQLLGLVHQDVSPHNVLVTFAGEVKLVDFGIARLMNTAEVAPPAEGTERPGGGKYAYMSPEQARGEPIDHRSDLFSTGIVLWELIVGKRLFQDPDPAEKLRRVREAVIPHPSEFGAPIDAALWAILERALARSPAARYPSAAVFEEDLRAWLFESRARVERAEIAATMAEAFPGEVNRADEDLELRSLADELGRLADGELTDPTALPVLGALRHPASERKPVVVLMLDVDGLTELSTRLDPEQVFFRHYELLRWMRRVVDRYSGVVQRAVDDQVTVMFGVPRTGTDDLPRALECALELQRSVGQLARKGMKLSLAIGVHAGEVTVQPVRHRVRYVARGDTTRLARKLSAVADHGQILISDAVRAAVDGRFAVRRGPDVPSRGGKEGLPSWLLEGRPGGLRITSTRGPWIRRSDELEVLRRAVVELQAGIGSTVAITGEVGSGKSRLIREIRELAQARGIPFFGARCATVADEQPLAPFADLVREIAEPVPRPLDPAVVVELFGPFGLSGRDLDVLAALLRVGRPTMAPERSELVGAVVRLFSALAKSDAFIAAIDDVHHLRPHEIESLRRVISGVLNAPVLFLLTGRGALPAGLGARSIQLASFRGEQSRRLAASLLRATDLSDDLAAVVERTCEGNPLYVVELLKWLVPGRVDVREGTAVLLRPLDPAELPHSLAGLVSARIDALDPPSKGVLQLAAVIGGTFTTALLGVAAGLEDATAVVDDLAAHGLVTRGDDGDWAFASELVREAAQRGILGVQRRDFHRMIAHAMESLQVGGSTVFSEALVGHCAEAGRLVDAARYAYAAGMQAEKHAQMERARQLWLAGLDALARAERNSDDWDARIQGEAMLNLRYGSVALLLGDLRAGERALQIALDVSSDAGLPWVEVPAHLELGRHYHRRGKHEVAAAHLDQALTLARLNDDRKLVRDALEAMAGLAFDDGRNAESEKLWSEALRLSEGDAGATARCESGLANRYLRAGRLDEAGALLSRALATAREASVRVLEGRVLNNIGLLHAQSGDSEQALTYFRQALEVREGLGYRRGVVINHHNIGDIHFERGDLARAHVAFSRSREIAEEMGWLRGVAMNDIFLAYIDAVRGASGVDPLEAAVGRARALTDGGTVAVGESLLGRWWKDHDRRVEAEEHYALALTAARESELTPLAANIEKVLEGMRARGGELARVAAQFRA